MAVRSGWDNAQRAKEEADERSKKNGKFLSLEDDGEKVVVAFLGEPTVREIVWENGKMSMFTPAHEARGVAPQVKFSFNVFNKELKKVQIFEQGSLWFKILLACKNKYGLDKAWFEIVRNGAKGDKETRYNTLFDSNMSDDDQRMMRELEKKGELYDLAKEAAGDGKNEDKPTGSSSSSSTSSGKSDAPISEKAKDMIISRLTELPGSATKSFLAEYSIQKIKELPQSAFDAALSFLEKLEASAKGAAEVDPFAP